jgi:hypothetical protein
MKTYRFSIRGSWTGYVLKTCKDIHAARAYAKAHNYKLCRHVDSDIEFVARCLRKS